MNKIIYLLIIAIILISLAEIASGPPAMPDHEWFNN